MGKFYIINCSYPQCSVDPKLWKQTTELPLLTISCYLSFYHTNTWLYANIAGPEQELVPGPDSLNDSLQVSGGEECKQ